MPARVHAIIVARADQPASIQLTRTLNAVRDQSSPPAAVTVVVLGNASHVRGSAEIGHLVEGIIEARSTTTYAEAVALAQPRVAEGSSVWLLAQDTAPRSTALRLLNGALERSPSAAIAAPKLVRRDDDREIVSLGVSMSRFGRTVELAAGELDQGQHDSVEDALGADVRGMLIRGAAPRVLRPDVALSGADEGLDLGVRARLGGARLVLVPKALVETTARGPAALPQSRVSRAWVTRRAQLHRRLAYAPAIAVPLHWLSLLPLALWRSITHLIGKRPGEVAPEWGAAIATMFRLPSLARSRAAIRSFRSASWASIAPLRVTRDDLRQRLDDGHGSERGVVSELRFFSGGGAWAVLAALVVSIAVFLPMLAWPAIGGGALLPLRETVGALWADAAWGLRDLGQGVVGPADPFAAVLAVLGTLWPGSPSFALVLLWLTALPLAVLGGWFAATRVTDRSGLRILAGVLWALAPMFLTALVQGRPAAVMLHLLLPWVLHSAVVAHRSWGAAGAASLLTVAALACAPSLAPAFVLLWSLALILMLAAGRLRGAARLFWLLVPSAVLFGPLIIWQLRDGDPRALLADPGASRIIEQAGEAVSRVVVAGGFPSADRAGWEWFAGAEFAVWAPLLLAPVAVLALASALSPRWRAGFALLLTSVVGLLTAMMATGVVVSFVHGAGVAVWPGTGLSLAWLGAVGAALVTLDTLVALTPLRVGAALVAGIAVAVCALPALLAVHTAHAEVRNGSTSTLPALVVARASGDDDTGTLVMTPLNDGSLAVELVWGPSETLGAQTTILSTATRPQGVDLSQNAVDLLSARDFEAAESLAEEGISFVLLERTPNENDRARSMRNEAVTAIDQRTGFVKAGETPHGLLWSIDVPIADRMSATAMQQTITTVVVTVQLVIVLAALLLAMPTRASRRAARSRSRVVGRAPEEPMVLPRRAARDEEQHRPEESDTQDAAAALEPAPIPPEQPDSVPTEVPTAEATDTPTDATDIPAADAADAPAAEATEDER